MSANDSLFSGVLLEHPVGWALLAALFVLLTVLSMLVMRLRTAQRHAEAIFEHATVGMGRCDLDKRWLEVNPALCRMLGYSAEALQQTTWLALTHPDDRPTNLALYDAVIRGERDGYELEKRFVRGDGSMLYAHISARAIRRPSGEIEDFVAVVEDITQRYLAERQFAQQVERSAVLLELPRMAEQLPEAEFIQFALGCAETLTGSRCGVLHFVDIGRGRWQPGGWSRNTVGTRLRDALMPSGPLQAAGVWSELQSKAMPSVRNEWSTAHEAAMMADCGITRLAFVPILENGQLQAVLGVGNKASDYGPYDVETLQLIGNETGRIVRRQRMETDLRLATQVVNASPVVCFRWAASDGWPVVFVSDNVRQWGYSPGQLQRNDPPFADLIHPEDLPAAHAEMQRACDSGTLALEQEYRILTAEKRVIWVVDRTQIRRHADGSLACLDGVLTDITEQKAQQQLLAENVTSLQQLNRRLEEANNQLLQSEKMASIGQLAAGIAHELNNPIGFVYSNIGTLDGYLHDLMAIVDAYHQAAVANGEAFPQLRSIEQLRDERDFEFVREDIFKLLVESKEGLGRVRKIVQDLKSFSRVGEQEWQAADLHQGLDSTLNIVWNELKYKCTVVKEYGDIPPVYCLISQLNQVFMNLLVNAGHAIAQKGTITIRTQPVGETQVAVEISDTGVGIAPENLNRIFEPFFTTKPVGKGTGLGLSLSYSIVQRHHGELTVQSTPGVGTTFRLVLPIHPPQPNDVSTEDRRP